MEAMNALRTILSSLVIALLYLSPSTQAANLHGKVVGISDGDTITILTTDKQSIKIRLIEIDAPEKDQPWGQKSKQALSDLIFSRNVTVDSTGSDRYGRTLGTVFLSNRNINKHMVENGNAWAYTEYVRDQNYFELQERAKSKQLGLWSLSKEQTMAPWEWRKNKK
ncbi:putative micrococcal nuclease [Cellvibrio sp. BR]|nr:putative micrococcal nuclease [Cellvibrio sp. BR]